ncbi:MAG: electron transfer flavoprotein subunit beta/FixA family protein [Armatimonadetes bacterium]|nr:electron transfer flavoprotein subunit beta/FixA family protein [Armatimonadota bacterium]
MDIIVCLKQVVDPELPARDFAIDPATRRQVREGRPLVLSTYDENALEVALQMKDHQGAKVTALTIAPQATVGDTVRLALAMGADEAVVIDDPRSPELSGPARARMLAAVIRKIGRYDLVLTGCESADLVERLIAPLLAEELGAACVTFVARIDAADGPLVVRRQADEGYHVVEARLPAVLSVTSDEANRPRLPKVKDIVTAKRKPVQIWTPGDLGSMADDGGVEVRDVAIPQRTGKCEFLTGDPAQQAEALALRLRELKLL